MPKRIPTPPPPEDEPRYLVVVHPYPLNANMMVHADRRGLALWLACCTGKDALLAVYHKPSVSRVFPLIPLSLGIGRRPRTFPRMMMVCCVDVLIWRYVSRQE